MPKKVKNKLTIIGSSEQVEQVRMFLKREPDEKNEEKIIDFNSILPAPPELDVEAQPAGKLYYFLLFGDDDGFSLITREEALSIAKKLSKKESQKAIELAILYRNNLLKFGHATHNSWIKKNWKVTSNAFDQSVDSRGEINFSTSYDGVPFLIEQLAKKFREIQFKYSWTVRLQTFECVFSEGALDCMNSSYLGPGIEPKRYFDINDYYPKIIS